MSGEMERDGWRGERVGWEANKQEIGRKCLYLCQSKSGASLESLYYIECLFFIEKDIDWEKDKSAKRKELWRA